MEKNNDFKKFLDKLTNQYKADLALQVLQVKYEREVATEDNDKREKQLDDLAKLLERLEEAITGIKVDFNLAPVTDQMEQQTQLLKSISEEQAMLRKLSEGSLEYDKQSAQYRNTSGREVKSVVSGKTVSKGGYVDFETARSAMTGQSKAAIERQVKAVEKNSVVNNNVTNLKTEELGPVPQIPSLKPIDYKPGDKSDLDKSVKALNETLKVFSKRLSDFKVPEEDKSVKENLKEAVAAYKQIGGGLFKGIQAIGSGIASTAKAAKTAITNPEEFKKQAGSLKGAVVEKARKTKESISEVVGVGSDYSVEKERFAKEYAKQKVAEPGQVKSEKELIKEGSDKYKEITNKESQISQTEKTIKEAQKMGFDPAENDVKRLEELKKELVSIDTRRKEAPISLPGSATVSSKVDAVNPESDNKRSASEILADNSKSDLELSQQALEVQKLQLDELKKISEALSPKVPGELPGPAKASADKKTSEEEGGSSLLGSLVDMVPGKGIAGALGRGAAAVGRGVAAAGKGALSLGGSALKFAGSSGGRLLGGAAAVGLGAYTAYKGLSAAEDSKQAKLEEVQAKIDAGELTPEQAAEQRKEIGNSATVEKSGAVGEGTGMAGGAIAGGLAGAKLGAAIGSIVPGAGTAIGAGIGTIAGGALGAFAGTKAGKAVGEYAGKGINAAGSFFGGIGDKVKDTYGYIKKQAGLDLSGGVGKEQAEMLVSSTGAVGTKETSIGGKVTTSETQTKGVTAEKSLFGSKFLGSLFSKKGQETGNFLTQGSEYSDQDGKVGTSKFGNLLGKRISGGLFGKDRYSVSLEGKDGVAEYDTQFTKKDYMEIQNLAKEGKYDEAEAKFKELKAKQEEVNAAVSAPSSPEEVGVTQAKGLEIKEIGSKISEFFSFGKKKNKVTDFNQLSEEGKAYHKFKLQQSTADVIKGQDKNTAVDVDPALKQKQEEAQKYGEELGRKISPVERKFVDQAFKDKSVPISAAKKGADVNARYKETEGQDLLKSSIENQDLQREATKPTPALPPIVSNSVSTNNSTSYVPIKAQPRPDIGGSALERYQNRIAVY